MRRKQLAKRVAIAVLSAATVMTAAPVGTFASTNVVSVDASDATEVTNPVVDANTSKDTKTIADALKVATVTAGASTASADGWKIGDATNQEIGGVPNTTLKFDVDTVSDVTFDLNSDGNDLGSAKVTLTVSVTGETTKDTKTTDTGLGTATIVVDLLDDSVSNVKTKDTDSAKQFQFSAAQKLAATKLVAEARFKAQNDGDGFSATDNNRSIASKLGLTGLTGLQKVNKDDSSSGTKANSSSAVTVTATTGTVVPATSTTEGSIPVTLKYTISSYDVDKKETKSTVSSDLTGVIPKTKQQNDTTYESKIENAVAAATWTSDDFDDVTDPSVPKLTADGLKKLQNVILGVDNNAKVETMSGVTLGRYTAGTHGKDGSASLNFSMARIDGGAAKTDKFAVRLTVVEGDTHVQDELSDAFAKGIEAAKKSLQKDAVADQKTAVKVITDAIDAELAKSANGKAYSADIKNYEVVVPVDGFKASSTSAADGYIAFYIKVDTGKTDSADPSKTKIWYFEPAAEAAEYATKSTTRPISSFTADDYKTFNKSTAGTTFKTVGEKSLLYINGLAKTTKVTATSISLPSTISYNVKAAGKNTASKAATGLNMKDYLTFTPATANTYKIRWTNSNTTDYTLYIDSNTNGKIDDDEKIGTWTQVADANTTIVLPTLTLNNDATSTTITAELIDDDGNVVATAKTIVTATNGFDDVQNASYFAYNPINALSNTQKLEKDSTVVDSKDYKTNGRDYKTLTVGAHTKLTASPVIAGIGNNKFDPYADVTRGQFITFLWRNAVNEYSFADAATQAYTKDPASYNGKTDFADVDAKAYYAKAVEWAAKNGIAFGSDATHFNPNKTITRAEAVSFIYRLEAQGAVYNNYQQFDDVSSSAYYANAVGYARSAGITAGKSGTKFAPNDTVTRGEAAAFIYRMAAGENGFHYDPVEA